jgi:hypothetical protein
MGSRQGNPNHVASDLPKNERREARLSGLIGEEEVPAFSGEAPKYLRSWNLPIHRTGAEVKNRFERGLVDCPSA